MIYRLNEKYLVPPFFVRVTLSFATALLVVTLILLANWLIGGDAILKGLPKPLSVFLDFCGAYAAFGSLFLYVLMWIYLFGFDRTSLFAKVGWAILLLFTLPFGALVYYFVALSRMRRTPERQN